MKLASVEHGRMVLDMAQPMLAHEHHFVGYGPLSEPFELPDCGGLESPRHELSEAVLQNDTRLDAAGWMDVWLAAAV
jgi:hypothetical protein